MSTHDNNASMCDAYESTAVAGAFDSVHIINDHNKCTAAKLDLRQQVH